MTRTTHNLGSDRRPFLVEFAVNPIFDLLIALWSGDNSDPKVDTFEIGQAWFEEFTAGIPDPIKGDLEELGGGEHHKAIWILMGVVADRRTGDTEIEPVLDWIRAEGHQAIRDEWLWAIAPEEASGVADGQDDAIDRVVRRFEEHRGEEKTECCSDHVESFERFLREDSADFNARLAGVLAGIRETAFAPFEGQWSSALQRSAESVALTVPGSQPSELIERITQGVDFQLPLGTTRIVLVPSVLLRPWSVVHESGSSVVVVYPVSEEHVNADPDEAPSWLVAFHKALGDSKRLKILRRLAAGPADLTELTQLLGMAKSSTFHHIGVLRSAGLVRVHLRGDEHSYDLRTQAFDNAVGLLGKYLDSPLLEESDFS